MHGTTGEIPFERLVGERQVLRRLAGPAYDTALVELRKVHKDCTFSFAGNYYSAPHRLVGQRVTVKADETQLRIFADGQVQAMHALGRGRGQRIIDLRHYEGIRRPRGSAVSRYETLFARWGSTGHAFVRGLLASRPADPYYHLGHVATLAADYPTDTAIAVFTRCLQYQAFEFQTVKRLLLETVKVAGDSSPRAGPAESTAAVNSLHAGAAATDVQCRPLSVYDVVTNGAPPPDGEPGPQRPRTPAAAKEVSASWPI